MRKTDGSYYKKTSLLSIRAALVRHLKVPESFKNMSLYNFIFSNDHQCNYTKTISRVKRHEYRRIVTWTSSRWLIFAYIHVIFGDSVDFCQPFFVLKRPFLSSMESWAALAPYSCSQGFLLHGKSPLSSYWYVRNEKTNTQTQKNKDKT